MSYIHFKGGFDPHTEYMTNNNDDFDKFFSRMFKFSIAAVIAYVVIALTLLGVGIWAVIALVSHFTQ